MTIQMQGKPTSQTFEDDGSWHEITDPAVPGIALDGDQRQTPQHRDKGRGLPRPRQPHLQTGQGRALDRLAR